MSTASPAGEMLRAELLRPGRVELRRVPVPVPAPGELVLRVQAALTCGTEIKLYQRGHAKIPLPTPLGHEFSGVVAALGEGVERFREGDAVACVPTAPCGRCRFCRRDRQNLCPHAVGGMVFGAFGEYVRLPARLVETSVFPRPSSLDAAEAALLEPLACVVHGTKRVDLGRAERLLLLGDGPIALLFLQLVRHLDAGPVLLLGKHPLRLGAARELGADRVVDLTTEPAEELVREWGGGGLPDLVVECVGRPEAWELALSLVGAGGELLLFGGCAPGTNVDFDAYRLHYEEVDVRGAFHYSPANARSALELLAAGAVRGEPLITHRLPLKHVEEAFRLVLDRQAIKVAIQP